MQLVSCDIERVYQYIGLDYLGNSYIYFYLSFERRLRGPLSLVSTTEELLERKITAPD
jgi:hypothetical protein